MPVYTAVVDVPLMRMEFEIEADDERGAKEKAIYTALERQFTSVRVTVVEKQNPTSITT